MKLLTLGKREMVICGLVLTLVLAISVFIPKGIDAIYTQATPKKLPIYSVDTTEKQIAVTFDCAWGNSDTDELLEILKLNGTPATFFFTGEWISKFPDDVTKIAAAGHSIQNHSDTHRHIDKLSFDQIKADIAACNEKIKALTGKTATLYRGPYGEYNDNSITAAEELNMLSLQWDTDIIYTIVKNTYCENLDNML